MAGNRERIVLVLKADGTLAVMGGDETVRGELAKLVAGVKDTVDVQASTYHLFALTAEGKVLGWQTEKKLGHDKGRVLDLSGLGDDIVQIDADYWGVGALDRRGKVRYARTGHGSGGKIEEPKDGKLRDIRRIWIAGYCGVALDGRGRLHAWGEDKANVGFVEKIEALEGFKDLAVMDWEKKGTFALWTE